MTRREIFDKVKTHLLKQNKKSFDDGWCLYRFGNLKCAIGCLIPNNLYDEKMECKAIPQLFNKFAEVMEKIGLKIEHRSLLKELQDIHDTNSPIVWEKRLNRLEEKWFDSMV